MPSFLRVVDASELESNHATRAKTRTSMIDCLQDTQTAIAPQQAAITVSNATATTAKLVKHAFWCPT